MRSRGSAIASVICFLLGAFFLLGGVGLTIGAVQTASYGTTSYWQLELEYAENLGTVYGEIAAEPGYTIYELCFTVKNLSTKSASRETPDLYFEGENYSDVSEFRVTESYDSYESLFSYDTRPILPGGRDTKMLTLVQVADGIAKIEAFYQPGYNDKEISIPISLD